MDLGKSQEWAILKDILEEAVKTKVATDEEVLKTGRRIVKLGKWNNQPLEWEVLQEDDFKELVVCRTAIATRRFDGTSNDWKNSELRKFLQEEFYEKAFSTEEKQKIVNTKLSDVGNSKDNVFVLSLKEVESLLKSYHYYIDNYAWTRTKHSRSDWGYVGCSSSSNYSLYVISSCYICPAMYLKK